MPLDPFDVAWEAYARLVGWLGQPDGSERLDRLERGPRAVLFEQVGAAADRVLDVVNDGTLAREEQLLWSLLVQVEAAATRFAAFAAARRPLDPDHLAGLLEVIRAAQRAHDEIVATRRP